MKQVDETEVEITKIIKDLPPAQKVVVVALKGLLDRRKELDRQLEQQIKVVVNKYRELNAPALQRASKIIRGAEINAHELNNADKYFNEAEKNLKNNFLKGKKIQKYWSTAIQNSKIHHLINITEEEKQVIQYLQNIELEIHSENIILTFEFAENPYFSNTSIKRVMNVKENTPHHSNGDKINWKEGKRLSKDKKVPGFFMIFENCEFQTESENQLLIQFQIFNEIANQLVPYSLEYYMGTAEEGYEQEQICIQGEDDEDQDDDEQNQN